MEPLEVNFYEQVEDEPTCRGGEERISPKMLNAGKKGTLKISGFPF